MSSKLKETFSPFGDRAAEISPVAKSLAAVAKAVKQGNEKIDLAVGKISEAKIPAEEILAYFSQMSPALLKEISNYAPLGGWPPLIQAIRDFHTRTGYWGIDREIMDDREIFVGAGATSLDYAVAEVLASPEGNFKAKAIVQEPWYYVFIDDIKALGVDVVTVPTVHGGMSVTGFKSALNRFRDHPEELAFSYVLPASNPEGTVMTNFKARRIVESNTEFSREVGEKRWIVSDEAYAPTTSLKKHPDSLITYDDEDLVIAIYTVSKLLGPALRVGWALAPKESTIANRVRNTFGHDRLNEVAISQYTVTQFLNDKAYTFEQRMADVAKHYQTKSREVRNAIEENLAPLGATFVGGTAGFYYYITLPEGTNIPLFHDYLLKRNGTRSDGPVIAVINGPDCVNPNGPLADIGKRQFRISYGFESIERVVDGLSIAAEGVKYAQPRRSF